MGDGNHPKKPLRKHTPATGQVVVERPVLQRYLRNLMIRPANGWGSISSSLDWISR